jgi:hypothetical protein
MNINASAYEHTCMEIGHEGNNETFLDTYLWDCTDETTNGCG